MVLPSNLQHLVPKITQAINIVVQYTENLSLPGCPAATAPICFNGTIVTSPNGTELSRTGGLVQCQAGATECGRVKVANRIHGNVVHWMNGFCSHPNHRPTCASIQAMPSVQGSFDSCVLSYCLTHAGCNLPAPTNTLMCYNGTIVTHPDGRLISNTGGLMRCPAGYTECGSATVVNKIGEHVVHWVSGFCSHPRYKVTCQTLLQSPLVQGTFDSCRVNFCTSTDCNNPEGVPSCDRFYGGTS
uniref:Uncharacterized protein n=1 Tax=Ciona savignyi TaxID=51511 RepID=H2Z5C2_CIOSA